MSLIWRTWQLGGCVTGGSKQNSRGGLGEEEREERAWEEKRDQTIKRWKCRVLARMSVGVAQCGRLDADKCEKEGERKRVEQVVEVLKLAPGHGGPGRGINVNSPKWRAGRPWSAARAGQGPSTASRHFLGAPIHWARARERPCCPRPRPALHPEISLEPASPSSCSGSHADTLGIGNVSVSPARYRASAVPSASPSPRALTRLY